MSDKKRESDRPMTGPFADGLDVNTRCYADAHERVAAFMESYRRQLVCHPGLLATSDEARRADVLRFVAGEDEPVPGPLLLVEKVRLQRRDDGDLPGAAPALGVDNPLYGVKTVTDVDIPEGKIYVLPAQGSKLSAAESSVRGDGPRGLVIDGEGVKELPDLIWSYDVGWTTLDGGSFNGDRRVDRYEVTLYCVPVHAPERVEGVPDGAG